MLKSLRLGILILIISAYTVDIHSQNNDDFDCPVIINGRTLKFPFTGGFNSPQFSNADFNQDGILDLFVFDGDGDVPMAFVSDGNNSSRGFTFSREYRKNLPDSMVSWALMRDYDNNGIYDLFTQPHFGNVSGVELFYGSLDNDGTIDYHTRKMGAPDSDKDYIQQFLPAANFWTNVPISFIDIPEIVDVDNDGDLDILTFGVGAGSYIEYFQNQQVEESLPVDSMKYISVDPCFGKFKESGLTADIFLNDNDTTCALEFDEKVDNPNRTGVHAGSTIMAYDNDGDNDLELVIGDLSTQTLVHLTNGGTTEMNFMTAVENNFPSYNEPVIISDFPAAYSVDVDGDGLKDMVATPNAINQSNINNISFYKNSGNSQSRFLKVKSSLLSEETIDLGSFSAPTFFDYNNDGLMDILVGSGGYTPQRTMLLQLFENKGTASSPIFELVDDDYLNFSQEYGQNYDNPTPTTGDLDGDGDIDIIISEFNGKLFYIENIAGANQPARFATPVFEFGGIDGTLRSQPAIVDINGDGLNDIILGQASIFGDSDRQTSGSVNYYQNIGSIGNPLFDGNRNTEFNTAALGNMHTKVTTDNSEDRVNSSPEYIVSEGELQILLGSGSGNLKRYKVNQDDLYGQFEVIDSVIGQYREGEQTTVAAYDIDNDNYYELLIGNRRGGLSFLNTEILVNMDVATDEEITNNKILIYPNPSKNELSILTDQPIENIMVTDVNGRLYHPSIDRNTINILSMLPGVYFLRFQLNGKEYKKKFIKI